MPNNATQYRLNPDYYKLMYYRARARASYALLNGTLIGFAMALLAYLTATSNR